MSENKTAEQEAEQVAREYVRSEWYESWPNTQGFAYDEICESEVEAHLAGQAVGEQRGYQRALELAENWCKADPESSFHPNLSSWRLYDYLKLKESL